MKKFLIIFKILTLLSFNAFADSAEGLVTRLNLYGGSWANDWRGGMLFKLSSMPAGVSYFTVHRDDIAQEKFLSLLMMSKAAGIKVSITYNPANVDANGYVRVLSLSQI